MRTQELTDIQWQTALYCEIFDDRCLSNLLSKLSAGEGSFIDSDSDLLIDMIDRLITSRSTREI
jgi:hypothetical protein